MTLPASGPITAGMINAELGRTTGTYFSINGAEERALAQVPSGTIAFSNFCGKSNAPITHQLGAALGIAGSIGYTQGSHGSLTPGTYGGAEVSFLGDGYSDFAFEVRGLYASNFINKIVINGQTFLPANASYAQNSGLTSWNWAVKASLVDGGNYPASIT